MLTAAAFKHHCKLFFSKQTSNSNDSDHQYRYFHPDNLVSTFNNISSNSYDLWCINRSDSFFPKHAFFQFLFCSSALNVYRFCVRNFSWLQENTTMLTTSLLPRNPGTLLFELFVYDSSSREATMVVGKCGYEPDIGTLKDNKTQKMHNCTHP
ncbi:uncharacterized protein LOC131628313 [Vicia villosa]|uniref:uncharacterized protein LOC131628313 n=1 Tax=Vicia villosa TaxID=3911 RepID=UPI00273CB78C|nr:uncharacterized protein LOC131628313 [Vicia villosa]